MHRDRGFTLIEVVVALFIVALALAAAVQLTANGADDVRQLTRHTYAQWVAMNRLSKAEIDPYPAAGDTYGQVRQAGSTWYWEQRVSDTSTTGLREIEIRVRATRDGSVLATVRSALGKTLVTQQSAAGATAQ
jgi:general secretion pathway protein I